MNSKKLLPFIQNVIAGLTVSFVALSLGAAFGLLSGRGAFAGMLSAALIAGITSAFGGTRIQCSGPTGPMTAVTAVMVAFVHDELSTTLPGVNPEHFLNIVLLLTAGLLILMAILRLGKYVTLVPNVVISGFMNGIAVIIWLDQLKRLFGFGGKEAFTGPFWENIGITVLTAALAFALPALWKKLIPKLASLLSATLIAIIVGTLITHLMNMKIELVHLDAAIRSWNDITQLVKGAWPAGAFTTGVLIAALPFALQLSILAYLDTLMTSLVVDKLTKEKTKQNKELFAQGAATAAVALVGGIPGAQATIRSVLMVKEKANGRIAGVLVGIFALIEMVLLQDAINLIPQAVFSGILFKVGYDVFDWTPLRLYLKEWFKNAHAMFNNFFSRHDDEPIFVTHREFFIIAGSTLVTILWDLNAAVAIFTALFYLHNKVFWKKNPMRDLNPATETEGMHDED